jgi:cell division protein ZapA
MNNAPHAASTVVVKILDREYQVSCPPSEQDALFKSARHLDENMRKIKTRGTVHGLEKISVMAALNITHELLQKNRQINESRQSTSQQIKFLEDKVERALQNFRQIELQ